ncbi:MAG: hypothetical protein KIT84_39380 [Labilithrix sp.]|nr:hypothetical protein [Labilithrix sp.]MCW5817125.1 hypothetical protein [Labilithrix sp.]
MRWGRRLLFGGAALTTAYACSTPFGVEALDAPPDSSEVNEAGTTSSEDGASEAHEDAAGDATSSLPPGCVDDPAVTDAACAGKAALSCGSSFSGYTGGANDLVDCVNKCVHRCASGCLVMPFGENDICDDCAGKPNGTYCIATFRDYEPATNQQLVVECKGGRGTKVASCGDGVSGICQQECKRTSPPPVFPACCNAAP